MRSLPLNVWSWATVEQGAADGGKSFISEELPSCQVLALNWELTVVLLLGYAYLEFVKVLAIEL